jgi:hypothetical protein
MPHTHQQETFEELAQQMLQMMADFQQQLQDFQESYTADSNALIESIHALRLDIEDEHKEDIRPNP